MIISLVFFVGIHDVESRIDVVVIAEIELSDRAFASRRRRVTGSESLGIWDGVADIAAVDID
jgi:hypothetical protein